ncbi:hypothetical protein TrST_g7269 [Triparma strigata]|uniref:Uncharacterized protein n=1 Tax=Triparma strigata TaxID=1606541 RepID=A0A9W7AG52_9STRA|nr:hypothetical protein TrST_g7269 [Triparma strigata]
MNPSLLLLLLLLILSTASVRSFVMTPVPTTTRMIPTSLNNWFDEIIEMATLGPSERRLKKAKERQQINDDYDAGDSRSVNDDDLTPAAFRLEISRLDAEKERQSSTAAVASEEPQFTGESFSSLLVKKYGAQLDVDLRPVTSFGKTSIYIAIMPLKAFGTRKSRFEAELPYLQHMQAVVEVLEKYGQLEEYVEFLEETEKRPRGGTSPLIAVTWKMELSDEEVGFITGN